MFCISSRFRDCTLKKWDGRTRLIASRRPKNATTDFSAFEKENVVSQIEKVRSVLTYTALISWKSEVIALSAHTALLSSIGDLFADVL